MKNGGSRRLFLQKCLTVGTGASGIGMILAGCAGTKNTAMAGKPSPEKQGNPCEDLTDVDSVDIEKRKALGYVSLSPIPDKQCDSCKLWIPVKEGKDCGGCLLFTGPVSPEGHCTYWAPQV